MSSRLSISRLTHALQRRAAKWLARRLFSIKSDLPLITFTFDDFPRSARSAGARILEDNGARGTFYVAMGIEGKTIATGDMFRASDLDHLLAHHHELGCHTFHHCPAWETPTREYERSVVLNANALWGIPQKVTPSSHSYPISYPRPSTKRRLAKRFRACRGGGQSLNHGRADLNFLSSFFLEQSLHDFSGIERLIADNSRRCGWLIFSTHDVASTPTRYGCSPDFFASVVRTAGQSGARIVTMSQALDLLGAPALPGTESRGGSGR